jgi:hypothetical protein
MAETARVFDEHVGKNTEEMASFEMCIVLAFKD